MAVCKMLSGLSLVAMEIDKGHTIIMIAKIDYSMTLKKKINWGHD